MPPNACSKTRACLGHIQEQSLCKKYQKERLDEAGDTKLAKDRGTGTVSADDIPETKSSDAKKVTSKRGTDTQDL